MRAHLPEWTHVCMYHIFTSLIAGKYVSGAVGVCAGACVAVSGGAAACSRLSPSPLAAFPLQAVEVNVIMEPPLLALPRGPAGWTLSFQLCFSPLRLTRHPSFSVCAVSVLDWVFLSVLLGSAHLSFLALFDLAVSNFDL